MADHAIEIDAETGFLAESALAFSPERAIALAAVTAFAATASLTVSSSVAIAAAASTSFLAASSFTVSRDHAIAAAPSTEFKASATLTGASDTVGISLCAIVNEVVNLWGIENKCSAPDFAIDRAINDVNAALQTVWNQSDDRNYWSNETLEITLGIDEASQDLADDIQNVTGPCKLADTKKPLTPAGTLSDLENFSAMFMDGQTADAPIAYHIERAKQSGNDPVKCTLHVTPAPTVETDLLLEVVKEAPRYSKADLDTCPIIPIPHRYAESLLLPVVRYRASSFWLFNTPDAKEAIDREYLQAMAAIGMADPLPGNAGDNLPEREKGGDR